MKSKIDEVVTVSNLRSAAGGRSYSRGEEYFQDGAVHHLYCDGEQLTADVHGTHVYHARITNDDGFLEGECNCPFGQDGNFCKHLVALGLAYLDNQKNASAKKNESNFSWKNFLKTCNKDELIKIIMEMSRNNTDIIERYRMANLPNSNGAKLRELKKKVDELFNIAEDIEEHYDEYWDSYDEDDSESEFIEEYKLLLNVMTKLSAQKEIDLLWDVSTYTVGKFLDSSNAEFDSVQEFVGEMMDYFVEAVHADVKSNDEVFTLFKEWEEKGGNFGYGILSDTLERLPEDIKEMWAAEALEKWRKYPPLQLGAYGSSDSERSYIEQLLLTWADHHQDGKLKLEILEKKMRYSGDVAELAREYRRQGMEDKIIPLLKTGHKAFNRDYEITDLLVEELQKAGKNDVALKMTWEDFTNDYMSDVALNRLQEVAVKMKCWKDYYQKALDFLEKKDKQKTKQPTAYFDYSDNIRQRRVVVLFTHGDQEAAWELAQGADLSEDWWLKLAEWRSKTMPDKSASLLKQILERALQPTGEDAYRHVIDLLKIYRKYLKLAGRESEFLAYCLSIRTEYKRRRLLMEQMNAAKL